MVSSLLPPPLWPPSSVACMAPPLLVHDRQVHAQESSLLLEMEPPQSVFGSRTIPCTSNLHPVNPNPSPPPSLTKTCNINPSPLSIPLPLVNQNVSVPPSDVVSSLAVNIETHSCSVFEPYFRYLLRQPPIFPSPPSPLSPSTISLNPSTSNLHRGRRKEKSISSDLIPSSPGSSGVYLANYRCVSPRALAISSKSPCSTDPIPLAILPPPYIAGCDKVYQSEEAWFARSKDSHYC
ncbi:hypothetical protein NE237_031221 [Protea cynaroides]|uniref:Uncharacterized protein n=1 Tax=Protea cynaroides TaxID=273540 RepID=A0A9Q0R292_9MAGN|nr:hypothetical protein NE237_031221 [Protea cynaroides]